MIFNNAIAIRDTDTLKMTANPVNSPVLRITFIHKPLILTCDMLMEAI